MNKTWIVGLLVVIVLYTGATLWFAAGESKIIYEQLTETIEHPPYADLDINRVELTTDDTVKLVGWEITAAPEDSSNYWLIYFHDRGQTVASNLDEYMLLRSMGLNVLAVDYRGFGESGGEPTEIGLGLDARACYHQIKHVRDIKSTDIILYGVGLGAAVAIDVAVDVNAAAVVVVAPYTSACAVVGECYPMFPVSYFISSEFNSLARIPQINTPKLFIPSGTGECGTANHARQLYDAASKYRTLFDWGDSPAGVYDHSFFTEISRLLVANSPIGLNLKTPQLLLSDSLLVWIDDEGIGYAVRMYQEIRNSDSTDYDLDEYQLDRIGQSLLQENRLQEAEQMFLLNIDAFPGSFHAYNQLAQVLIRSGDSETAEGYLRRSLTLQPNNNPATELLQNLTR